MKKNAEKSALQPTCRELELLETLRRNPALMGHFEELAMMTRNPEDLLMDGNQAEEKVVALCRAVGKAGMQGWASAANQASQEQAEASRVKGQHVHGKKNSTG